MTSDDGAVQAPGTVRPYLSGEPLEDLATRLEQSPGWAASAQHVSARPGYLAQVAVDRRFRQLAVVATSDGGQVLGFVRIVVPKGSGVRIEEDSDPRRHLDRLRGTPAQALWFVGGYGEMRFDLAVQPDLPAAEASEVRHAVLSRARDLSREAGATLCAMFVHEPDSAAVTAVLEDNDRVEGPVRWILPTGYDDVDELEASLKRSHRSVLRRDRRRAASLGLRVETRPLREVTDHELGLIQRVQARHGDVEPLPLLRHRLETLARSTSQDAVIFSASGRPDPDRPSAVSVAVLTGSTLELREAGVGAGEESLDAYLMVLFEQPIRAALERGAATIDYGYEAGHTKRLRGCVEMPTHHLFDTSAPIRSTVVDPEMESQKV